MDLFQEVQKLASAADDLVQVGAKQFNESIDAVKNTAVDLSTAIDKFQQQAGQLAQEGCDGLSETLDTVKKAAFALGVTGGAIAEALKDLPNTAEALARDMPKIAYRLRNRAGLRVGDAPRADADVMQLFEKIPGTAKLGASETKIREFLADKHGSHIISRQQGGSNGAENILWEIGTDNIRRGAKVMTGSEQVYIRFYNAVDSLVKNSGTIAKLGATATGTAILTQAVVTAVAYALDLYRGDITVDEFRDHIVSAALSAGVATPIFFLVFMAVIALLPELAVLLSAPIMVAGFNALFGIGIAVPIMQSLVRHLEAGGFGEDVAEAYQHWVGCVEPSVLERVDSHKAMQQA